MADRSDSWSGLSDQEAQEFHQFYIQGLLLFVAIAVVAHILVWLWRPWIPPAGGYKAATLDGVTTVTNAVVSLLT
jgi:light-harvesting complex 1 beta chain